MVKAEENLKAKSLKVFREKYNPSLVIRASMSDYLEQETLTNIPLFAISQTGHQGRPRFGCSLCRGHL